MTMFATFAERFESGARRAAPYGLMLLLLFLNSALAPFPGAIDLKAPFFLMGVYYWSIYRPTLIPPWIAFVAGIVTDLLGGMPPGLNAGIFVLAQWLISDQRRFLTGQSFIVIWFGFLLLSVCAAFLQWLIYGMVSLAWVPMKSLGFSILLGAALFPIVCVALHGTHRLLPSPAGSLKS